MDKRLAPWAVVADGGGWWSKVYFYIKVTVKSVNSVSLFPFWSFSHLPRLSKSGRTRDPDHDTRRLSSCLYNHLCPQDLPDPFVISSWQSFDEGCYAEACKTLERMQQSITITTVTKSRMITSTCKILQNQIPNCPTQARKQIPWATRINLS